LLGKASDYCSLIPDLDKKVSGIRGQESASVLGNIRFSPLGESGAIDFRSDLPLPNISVTSEIVVTSLSAAKKPMIGT